MRASTRLVVGSFLLPRIRSQMDEIQQRLNDDKRALNLLRDAATRLRLGVSDDEVLATLTAKGIILSPIGDSR